MRRVVLYATGMGGRRQTLRGIRWGASRELGSRISVSGMSFSHLLRCGRNGLTNSKDSAPTGCHVPARSVIPPVQQKAKGYVRRNASGESKGVVVECACPVF